MTSSRAPARGRRPRAGLGAVSALLLAGCGGGRSDAVPARHEVVIRAFAFSPPALAVAAGDTVVWRNEDIVPHTATAEDGGWSSDSLAVGSSWRRVFVERGSDAYHCLFHPVMKGRVETR